jgi:hypothetical protein
MFIRKLQGTMSLLSGRNNEVFHILGNIYWIITDIMSQDSSDSKWQVMRWITGVQFLAGGFFFSLAWAEQLWDLLHLLSNGHQT